MCIRDRYDSMDAIYAYDPRFQYAKGGELAKVARETGYANILVVLSAVPLVVLNCVIYYFVRKNYFPPESEHLIPEAANIYLLAKMCIRDRFISAPRRITRTSERTCSGMSRASAVSYPRESFLCRSWQEFVRRFRMIWRSRVSSTEPCASLILAAA